MPGNQRARVHEAPLPQEPIAGDITGLDPVAILERALALSARQVEVLERTLASPLTQSARRRETRALTTLLAEMGDLSGRLAKLKPVDQEALPALQIIEIDHDRHALLRLLPDSLVTVLYSHFRGSNGVLQPLSETALLEGLEALREAATAPRMPTEAELDALPVVETAEPTTTPEPVEEPAPHVQMGEVGQPRIVHRRQEPPPWQEDDAGNRYPLRPDDATSYEPSRRLVNYANQPGFEYLNAVVNERQEDACDLSQ